jgi:GntR family transcriptional regulator / MocR family aminotransferase
LTVARWQHPIAIDPGAPLPVFLQIARAIADDVRRGRLKRGEVLPGSRTLADEIGVHRNTVLAAYRELSSEGWIETRRAGGTYVSKELPDSAPRAFAPRVTTRERLGFDLAPGAFQHWDLPPYPRGTLVLASGVPDARLVPTAPLARAYRRALKLSGPALLGYGDPRGALRLREALAAMLSHLRGLPADPASFLVTRGSQGAIDLVARALIKPGDVVAVEALGYRPAWSAFQAAGAQLVAVPVDEHGMRVEALAAIKPRAVYVTPHHQFPTMVTMSAGRRLTLLELARTHRFAIVEDDYDFEFHYEGRPVLPLASADRAGVVVHVGTLSKILAPGVRIGFVTAPAPLLDRLTSIRIVVDRQGDLAVEHAVAELLEDSEVQRHARRMKREYRARRDVLIEAIHEKLGRVMTVDPPAGGMAVWARVDPSVDVDDWAVRALAAGVSFLPARSFAFDGRARPFARLGFASLNRDELREAVRRMAVSLKKRRSA